MELHFDVTGTFSHPKARTPDDRFARDIYYSMTSTETERMLAEKLMTAVDLAEAVDAEIEEAQNEAFESEKKLDHLREKFEALEQDLEYKLEELNEEWSDKYDELAEKTSADLVAENAELRANILDLESKLDTAQIKFANFARSIHEADRKKRKTLKVADLALLLQ